MDGRVVGGCAALALAALLACDVAPSRPVADPSIELVVAPPIALGSRPGASEGASGIPSVERGALDGSDAPSRSTARPSRLVLVTIDGVRWEDVFVTGRRDARRDIAESMPSLRRLVRERGLALGGPGCNHDLRASGPNFVSLPGYLEMFTGTTTTCTHNECAPVQSATVIDEARSVAKRPGDVAVFSSWGKYGHAVARDRRAIVLSAGASVTSGRAPAFGAAKDDAELRSLLAVGAASSGYPGHGDYRPDEHTARLALRYLEVAEPRLLVIGLGDADEYAHRGDIAGYRRAIRRADDVLGDLDRVLARMGDKETAVLVTTDHGRSRSLRAHGALFPESQRVFLAAFGSGIARRGVTCAAEPLRLSHLAGAMRALLALEGEAGPLAGEITAGLRSASDER